ncbi:serine hydrolase, partial [Blautia massiliensis (ex Durand et al. 2017)]
GIKDEVETANKTGETDEDQHDIAIVYGVKTTYVLCVMSEGWKSGGDAVENIRNISSMVYNYLNL